MRNEPVIAGIAHGGIEKPVDDQRAGVLVHLVFDRLAAHGHFDDDVDGMRRIDPDRDGVNTHAKAPALKNQWSQSNTGLACVSTGLSTLFWKMLNGQVTP